MTIDKLTAQVLTAHELLDAALEFGENTEYAREALSAAEARLAAAEAAPPPALDYETIRSEAYRLAAAAQKTISTGIAEEIRISYPVVEIPAHAAVQLAEARAECAAHADKVSAHHARVERLKVRRDELDADRDLIVTRRAGGNHEPDDDLKLARLDADLQDLAALIARAEAYPLPAPPDSSVVERQWAEFLRDTEFGARMRLGVELQDALIKVTSGSNGASDSLRVKADPVLRRVVDEGLW